MKITVGVCAYNVQDYIRQCIESILAQTYEDLQIIIIDDGSSDETPRLLDELARKDPRIVLIHKANAGHAAGREQILSLMQGKAIYWVDADDWIEPQAIETSAKLLVEEEADIVKVPIGPRDPDHAGTYDRETYLAVLLPNLIQSNVIGCLIRKEVYAGVHHLIGYTNEDYYIFPRLADNCHKIIVRPERDYHYRFVRPGSITSKGRTCFAGYYPRAYNKADRYKRYKDSYPKECALVLRDFVNDACLAVMFAKKDEPGKAEVLELMAELKDLVQSSAIISRYKKWLYAKILEDSFWINILRPLHRQRAWIRARQERRNRPV